MFKDIKNYFANFDGITDSCRTVALWIAVALLIAFVATKLYVAVAGKRSGRSSAELTLTNKLINGAWIAVALVAAACFIVVFTVCHFTDVAPDEDVLVPILFYPLMITAVCVVASAAALFAKPTKLVKIVCASVCGGAVVAALVCMIVYYSSGKAGAAHSNIGLYLSSVLLVAAVVVFAFLSDRKSGGIDTRTVTYAAVCVALSFALSYVRLFKMPMGGSITLASMLPLMLFAFMFGSRKGILVGAIYGILQAIQDPWIIHPAQFVLDYVIAFASIGLTGVIRELGAFKGNLRAQFAVGAVIACAFRFLSHYFAGVFAFGMYGEVFAADYGIPALANAYFYSFVYQCMYLIPELIIVTVAAMLALTSSAFRRQIEIRIASGARNASKPAAADSALPDNDADVAEAAVERDGDAAVKDAVSNASES